MIRSMRWIWIYIDVYLIRRCRRKNFRDTVDVNSSGAFWILIVGCSHFFKRQRQNSRYWCSLSSPSYHQIRWIMGKPAEDIQVCLQFIISFLGGNVDCLLSCWQLFDLLMEKLLRTYPHSLLISSTQHVHSRQKQRWKGIARLSRCEIW